MEDRLLMIIALTGVTLILNTVILLVAYVAFAKLTTKVTESVRAYEETSEIRSWLRWMETASRQTVIVAENANQSLQRFGPRLAQAQEAFSHRLAKVDAKLDRAQKAVTEAAGQGGELIAAPASNIGSAATGVLTVLEIVACYDNDAESDLYRRK